MVGIKVIGITYLIYILSNKSYEQTSWQCLKTFK